MLDPNADDDAWDDAPLPYISWADRRAASLLPESLHVPESIIYAATWDGFPLRWSSPIYMPRWASRITLEITDVEPQRLMKITDADAWAEGVRPADSSVSRYEGEYRDLFLKGWEQLHGVDSVQANPWVWAITFKQVNP